LSETMVTNTLTHQHLENMIRVNSIGGRRTASKSEELGIHIPLKGSLGEKSDILEKIRSIVQPLGYDYNLRGPINEGGKTFLSVYTNNATNDESELAAEKPKLVTVAKRLIDEINDYVDFKELEKHLRMD
jgi:hypothetical protein